MITLLSALLGFFSAALPDVLKLWRDKNDKLHELAVLDRQVDLQKAGLSQRTEEIRLQTDIAETQALYQTYHSGVTWVDALNGTVRPVLAYAFFLLYAATKWLQFDLLADVEPQVITILWQTEDQAIFAGIISFYFGQRAMAKLQRSRA